MQTGMVTDLHAAEIVIATDLRMLPGPVNHREGLAQMRLAQVELAPHRIIHRRRCRQQQAPLLAIVASNLFLLHHVFDRNEGLHQFAIDALGVIEAPSLHDLAEPMLQCPPDIAGIAGRGAVAWFMRLEHCHPPPSPRQVDCRYKPGDAGADDRHIRLLRQRGRYRVLMRCRTPPIGIKRRG